jgi:hypothetical protein
VLHARVQSGCEARLVSHRGAASPQHSRLRCRRSDSGCGRAHVPACVCIGLHTHAHASSCRRTWRQQGPGVSRCCVSAHLASAGPRCVTLLRVRSTGQERGLHCCCSTCGCVLL